MSGRDLRAFITNYRAEDEEKLTLRMKDGLGSSKYKPAEYEKLQAIVEVKRRESDLIGQKVQRTQSAAKASKESSILRQHRQVLSREYPTLATAEATAENDLHDFIGQIKPSSRADTGIFSLQDYELFLQREREAFSMATVEPVHQLRGDLRFRLGEIQHPQLNAHPSDWEQVLQQVNFVKDQQEDISERLHAEYLALEEEITALGLEDSLTSASDILLNTEEIPEEVLDSDCPYPALKNSLVQAFHFLSERYRSRLQSLQERLLGIDKFCGWCADDHLRFQLTVGRYPHDMPNRRALYMDMLQRLFPRTTRQKLTEHERIWAWQRFSQAQLRAVAQSWQRDLEQLLARALVTLEEARHAHQEELELHRDRQHQQDICSGLRDKREAHAQLTKKIAAFHIQWDEERARLLAQEAERDSLEKTKIKTLQLQWEEAAQLKMDKEGGGTGHNDPALGRRRKKQWSSFS